MKLPRFSPTLVLLACGVVACASPPKDTVRTDPAPRATTEQPARPSGKSAAKKTPARAPRRPSAPATLAPTGAVSGRAILATAKTYLGVPYRYGGNDRRGLDCSALVANVFRENHVPVPRTSATQFAAAATVAPKDVGPGDLVFFKNARGQVNHVGIYAGRGRFIHASTGKREVRYDSLTTPWFRKRYAGARRITSPLAR